MRRLSLVMMSFALCGLMLLGATQCSSSSEDEFECTLDADCDSNNRCLNGQCVSLVCMQDNDCLATEVCEIPTGEVTGLCKAATITDGDDDQAEAAVQNCDINDIRCRGDELQTCQKKNGVWDFRLSQVCECGCENERCVECVDGDPDLELEPELEPEPEPICRAGDYRCYSNQVQLCSDDGMEWRVDDPCLSGTCVEQLPDAWCGPKLICDPGMRLCDLEGRNAVATCNSEGTDWSLMYCAASQECEDGICVAGGECTANYYRCNGNAVEKCAQDGSGWVPVKNCGSTEVCSCGQYVGTNCAMADCIATAVCTPWQRQCSGNVVQMCSFDGTQWSNIETCADEETCSNGQCI